jgi:hypothetical protein
MVNRVGSGSGYRIYDSVNLADNTDSQVSDNAGRNDSSYKNISENLNDDDRAGVVLDLSTGKDPGGVHPDVPAPEGSSGRDDVNSGSTASSSDMSGIISTVRNIFRQIGEFFSTLWNGKPAADNTAAGPAASDGDASAASGSVPAETAENESDPAFAENVADLPRTDDISSIRSYLNDYGGHRLAHGSDLLTSYDRFGRLVEPNVSDKDKILRGDSSSLMDQLDKK